MTSTKPTATPAADTDETATRVGPMHQAFADFLNTDHGAGGITAEQVFLVTSKRKAFRATDAYRVGVKAAQADAKAQAAAAREKARAERAAAKAEKGATATPAPAEKPEPKPAAKRGAKPKAAGSPATALSKS